MSKRLFVLITIVSMLVVFSVAQAQQPTTFDEPNFVLTAEQINDEFSIPSTTTRQISNLEVDAQEEGLHISFQMTVTRDGTTNTLNIIAILIGLSDRPRVSALELENTLISNYVVPPSLRQEVMTLLLRSWNDYEASILADLPIAQVPIEGFIMQDGKICDPIRHIGC